MISTGSALHAFTPGAILFILPNLSGTKARHIIKRSRPGPARLRCLNPVRNNSPLKTRTADASLTGPLPAHLHRAPPGRLPGHELILVQPLLPEGAQATMGRPGNRVFGDADAGGEEAGDEIVTRPGGGGSDHYPALSQGAQFGQVGLQFKYFLLGGHFHQVVDAVAPGKQRLDSQSRYDAGVNFLGPGRLGRKIQLNPPALLPGGEQAAEGVKPYCLAGPGQTLAEEDMGGGRVAWRRGPLPPQG